MIRKIFSAFRQYGAYVGFLYIVARLLHTLSPRLGLFSYSFMAQPVPETPLLPANFLKSLTFRELKASDPEMHLMPVGPDVKKFRFQQGAICIGAFRGSTLLGYIWLCFESYNEDEVRCTYKLSAHESVFDFDLYIFPEHRMGLAFPAIWHGANEVLRARGVSYSFSRLSRFNLASRRAHDRLKWRKVGGALFLKAGHLEIMFATLAPYVWISKRARDRVSLELRLKSAGKESQR